MAVPRWRVLLAGLREAVRTIVWQPVITHDTMFGRLLAVIRGTVILSLWLKVEEGLTRPINSRRDGKGSLNTRVM